MRVLLAIESVTFWDESLLLSVTLRPVWQFQTPICEGINHPDHNLIFFFFTYLHDKIPNIMSSQSHLHVYQSQMMRYKIRNAEEATETLLPKYTLGEMEREGEERERNTHFSNTHFKIHILGTSYDV